MSLLLDALKKAALEKQRREQAAQTGAQGASTEKVAEPTPVASIPEPELVVANVASEVIVETSDPEADSLEFDLDAIDDNYQSVMEAEQQAKIISAQTSGLLLEPLPEPTSEVSLEQPAASQEILIDEALIQRSLDEAKAQANALTQPMAVSPKITRAEQSTQPSTPQSPQPSTQESTQQPTPQPAQQPVEKTAAAATLSTTTATESLAEVAAPIAASHIASFNAHSGKDALNQLLNRSSQAAQKARKRMIVIYALLTFTSVTLVGLYYYLLSSGGTITQPMAENAAPVGDEIVSADTLLDGELEGELGSELKNETEAEEIITENISAVPESVLTGSAGLTDDTGIAEEMPSPDDTATNAATNAAATTPANLVSEKTLSKKTVAEKLAAKKAITPVKKTTPTQQTSARSVSLPIDQPAKQGIISRQAAVDDVSESIRRGYQAYQAGDFAAAELAYRDALAEDPHQRDALLGAAAVAVQLNRQEDALRLYQQRLARAPKDEYAQAGILALTSNSDNNPQFDSELNRLLREFPSAAHLHFLKGSLYAARQQWAAAQLAFFEAWQRDNKNPNYAFNLAVAMDHIQEPKEAIRFYQQALLLSDGRQVGFSSAAVQQRVQELEQQ